MRKESIISFSAMRPLEFCGKTIRSVNDNNICHNLRQSSSGRGLVPVGQPGPMTPGDFPRAKLLPGGEYVHPDGHITLFLRDVCRLLCIENGHSSYLEDFGDDPEAIVTVGDTMLVMMGEGKIPMELYHDGKKWNWRRQPEAPDPISIVRKDEGVISAEIDSRSLSGVYSSRSSSLTSRDARELSDAMVDAYCSIGDRATSGRVFFQPVIARYRLRGHDGRILFSSAPVIIAPSDGPQLTSVTFTLSGSNFSLTSAATLSARTFSLGLRCEGELSERWCQAVGSVELLVSPQLHPLEESRGATHFFGRFSATTGSVTMMLPGVGAGGGTSVGIGLRPQVAVILGRLDSVLEPIGATRYDALDSEWSGFDHPFYSGHRDLMSDIKAMRSALSLPLPNRDDDVAVVSRMSMPHILNASVAASGGDLVALASLTAVRFGGWLPVELMTVDTRSAQAGEVSTACKVIFSDGSSRVRSMSLVNPGLGGLSPLMSYPSPDAVAVELHQDGRFMRFDLVPDPSGCMSYWLSDELKPVDFSAAEESHSSPRESPLPMRFPGLVAVARASLPLSPLAVTQNSAGDSVAIEVAPGVSGGWDGGAGRFYLFGRGGIQALTVNSGRKRISLRHLDGRPVESREAVCPTSEGVAAIAGGDLVSVSGQKVRTLRPYVEATALGWNPRHEEIICCYNADYPCPENFTLPPRLGMNPEPLFPAALVLSLDGRLIGSRSLPEMTSWRSTATGFRACGADGVVYDMLDETDGAVDAVFFSRKELGTRFSDRRAARRLVSLPLIGEVDDATVDIHADSGGGPAMSDPMASYRLSGLIRHLPPFQILFPHAHAISLTLRFTARPSAVRLP